VPYLYNVVKPRATHNVMISHPGEGDTFGFLLRDVRERSSVRQEDVADALNVSRTLITKWEAGKRKRPITGGDVEEALAEVLVGLIDDGSLQHLGRLEPQQQSLRPTRHPRWESRAR
jgi:transcriptional regulator with XRE-family HTH domain